MFGSSAKAVETGIDEQTNKKLSGEGPTNNFGATWKGLLEFMIISSDGLNDQQEICV
jgi:hypothetical protein